MHDDAFVFVRQFFSLPHQSKPLTGTVSYVINCRPYGLRLTEMIQSRMFAIAVAVLIVIESTAALNFDELPNHDFSIRKLNLRVQETTVTEVLVGLVIGFIVTILASLILLIVSAAAIRFYQKSRKIDKIVLPVYTNPAPTFRPPSWAALRRRS
jgi:hypothetical protein